MHKYKEEINTKHRQHAKEQKDEGVQDHEGEMHRKNRKYAQKHKEEINTKCREHAKELKDLCVN